jgi:hypothetical protein
MKLKVRVLISCIPLLLWLLAYIFMPYFNFKGEIYSNDQLDTNPDQSDSDCLCLTIYDRDRPQTALWSLELESFNINNNQIGIFSSAVHRKLTINGSSG